MQYHAVPQQEYQGPLSMQQAAIHAAPASTAGSWITNPDAPVTIGGVSFVTQTAAVDMWFPKNLTLNEYGEVVFDRGDGLRFRLEDERVIVIVPSGWGVSIVAGCSGEHLSFINDDLRARGLPLVTLMDVENFRSQAIAFMPANASQCYW